MEPNASQIYSRPFKNDVKMIGSTHPQTLDPCHGLLLSHNTDEPGQEAQNQIATTCVTSETLATRQPQDLQGGLRQALVMADALAQSRIASTKKSEAAVRDLNTLLLQLNERYVPAITTHKQETHFKPADRLITLPLEVLQTIFASLEYKQHVSGLRVCKSWKKILGSLPPLSDTINFRNASEEVNSVMLDAALNRLSDSPKSVVVSHLTSHAAEILTRHVAEWLQHESLKHLGLYNKRFHIENPELQIGALESIILGMEVKVDVSDMHSILRRCPNLKSATFEWVGCTESSNFIFDWEPASPHVHLENLVIVSAQPESPWPVTNRAFTCFLNLTSLVCRGVVFTDGTEFMGSHIDARALDLSKLRQLRELDLSESSVSLEPALPESLMSYKVGRQSSWVEPPVSPLFAQLKVLDLRDCGADRAYRGAVGFPTIGDKGVFSACEIGQSQVEELLLETRKSALSSLHFLLWTEFGGNLLSNVRCMHLKFGNLPRLDFTSLISYMPQLQKVVLQGDAWRDRDVDHSPKGFLDDLLSHPAHQIRHITLRTCSKGPDWRDVVVLAKWIRSQGVMASLEEYHGNHQD